MQKIFTVIIITLNTIGVFFFTGMDFPIFGIALSILSILCSIFFSEYVWMHVFATTVIRSHNIGKYFSKGNANRIVISVAFLSLAVKIGVLIKTGIYLVALLLVTVAILLASGFFFEGRSSGMSITGAYNISKILRNYSAPRLGYINFWSKQRKYNFCFIIALLRKVDNFSM